MNSAEKLSIYYKKSSSIWDTNLIIWSSKIIKSASQQLNCLLRLGHYLYINTRLLFYKSFVLSNFNYCSAVWHFCGASNSAKLEKLQFRALKFIFDRYDLDYSTLLRMANLPTLELSRMKNIATEVYKAVQGSNPEYINRVFKPNAHGYSLRAKYTVRASTCHTTKGGLHSGKNFGTKIWNSLPNELRTGKNFPTFKRLLRHWDGFSCKCCSCRQ